MKKLSVFQIVLLATFGAIAVAGILIFALAVGGGSSSTIGPVTIWGTLDKNAFDAVLRQAADSNNQLNQVTYVQKDAPTYESDLTDALASGTGPDLFLLRQDYAVKDAGKIAPIPLSSLSQSQFESTFIDAAAPFSTKGGTLGVPIAADPLVLYWNKDALASEGYASPPRYWEELHAMAQKISKKDDTGSIVKSAIALGEYGNVDNAKDILATIILQAGGSITSYDATGHLVSGLVPKTGELTTATPSALRFYTDFSDPSKDYYSWNRSLPDAELAFTSGTLALYIGYASEEPQLAHMNPNLNFAVAPLPQIQSSSRTLDFAHVYALAATRGGKNPSGAQTVAFLLASAPNSSALSLALGIPSARRDVLAAAAQKTIPDVLASAGDLCGGRPVDECSVAMAHSWIDPDPEATASIFRAMIEDTTSGTTLLSEAVSRADQAMGHILGL